MAPGNIQRTALRRRHFLILTIIAIALLGMLCENVLSHPHVFIVQRIEVVFDDEGLAGFRIEWNFDEMFSSMIIGDYDKNQNRYLDPDEIAVIKEEAFSYVSNYNYFTFIRIDGNPFEVKYIEDFSAKILDNKLTYEFFVPCHVVAISSLKHVIIATYDPSYYTAVFFAKEHPAALANADIFEVKSAIKEDKATSIYYDMVHPWALFLDFRKNK